MESTIYDYVRSATQSRESLRFGYVYGSSCGKLYHLVTEKSVTRSNLNTINRIGAFIVVRAKTNVGIKYKIWKRRLPECVVSDVIGCFTVYKSSKDYPEELRKLIIENPENGTLYIFLTNNLDAFAELVLSLYQNRCSVELFFKWIKQHLRIKKFWGT